MNRPNAEKVNGIVKREIAGNIALEPEEHLFVSMVQHQLSKGNDLTHTEQTVLDRLWNTAKKARSN